MALSPQYGWSEPDNSSLVKNGAADIRTLGDAIDTSVWNVGFGQAGKNKIINGDFSINQRSFTTDTIGAYGFDRWLWGSSGATGTYSTEAFTAGAAPVAGYEATNFARIAVTTGNDFCRLIQRIESVRTFAGQTATLSFWAKGTNPTTAGKLSVRISQNFGSGGSAAVASAEQDLTLTANWVRYSYTFVVPSISGKTIGTSSFLEVGIGQATNASTESWTLDVWGVQLEYGSKATPFQTATGSIQGELAACQRYYNRITPSTGTYEVLGSGYAISTTVTTITVPFPVSMRVKPTAVETTGTASNYAVLNGSGAVVACSVVPAIDSQNTNLTGLLSATVASGLTAGQGTQLRANNTTAAYIGWSAEL